MEVRMRAFRDVGRDALDSKQVPDTMQEESNPNAHELGHVSWQYGQAFTHELRSRLFSERDDREGEPLGKDVAECRVLP